MAQFVATYDLSGADAGLISALIDEAALMGWLEYVDALDGYRYRLPTNTLLGTFDTLSAAAEAFEAIVLHAESLLGREIMVEKRFIIEFASGTVASDHFQKLDR